MWDILLQWLFSLLNSIMEHIIIILIIHYIITDDDCSKELNICVQNYSLLTLEISCLSILSISYVESVMVQVQCTTGLKYFHFIPALGTTSQGKCTMMMSRVLFLCIYEILLFSINIELLWSIYSFENYNLLEAIRNNKLC